MRFFKNILKLMRKFEDEAVAIAYAEAGEIECAREVLTEIDKERAKRGSEEVQMPIRPLEERS